MTGANAASAAVILPAFLNSTRPLRVYKLIECTHHFPSERAPNRTMYRRLLSVVKCREPSGCISSRCEDRVGERGRISGISSRTNFQGLPQRTESRGTLSIPLLLSLTTDTDRVEKGNREGKEDALLLISLLFQSCCCPNVCLCVLLFNAIVSPAQRQQQMKKPVIGTAIAIINPTTATAKIPA